MNNPQLITKELLDIIQILYQNKLISAEEKNELVVFLKESLISRDTKKLNEKFVDLSYEIITFKNYLNKAIELTN